MDIVLMTQSVSPIVCKLDDYKGKLYTQFEQKIQGNLVKKSQEAFEPNLIQISDRISMQDLKVKIGKAQKQMDKKGQKELII